jgi:protoporphyrinogen oxidase
MQVAVIGAGPAGLTAALALSRGGANATVYEAGKQVGGLARSIDLWGQRVDLGPHRFFSTDSRVNRFWLEVAGRDYRMVERQTRIYYDGEFYRYPLQPLDALGKMGLGRASACLASYGRERLRLRGVPDDAPSFESWIVGRFGRRLFEMFFKSYSEKLWGIHCEQLSADFAAQRIKNFSLGEAVREVLSASKRSRHRTLVDRFAYPLGGTGSIYEQMAGQVKALGNQVKLNAPVRRVVFDGQRVSGIELSDNSIEPCDHAISTMPLPQLVQGLTSVPPAVLAASDRLRFRNTILVYLHVDGDQLFDDQWVYVHAPELRMGRVTNFRNWVPELYGSAKTTILAAEFWCDSSDAAWSESDVLLIERATNELATTSLLGGAKVLSGHVVRIPRCYPVYEIDYRDHLQKVVEHLRSYQGLTVIGRYGAFKYNNQDHSILMGILAAENLLADQQHDLWSVNTDYDAYHERSLITETGLVEQV